MLLEYMPAKNKINSPPSFDGGICSNQAFRCLRFAVEHSVDSDSARYTSLTVEKKTQLANGLHYLQPSLNESAFESMPELTDNVDVVRMAVDSETQDLTMP